MLRLTPCLIICVVWAFLPARLAVSHAQEVAVQGSADSQPPHDYSCGSNALYLLLKLMGERVTVEQIRTHLATGEEGESSLEQMQDWAAQFGLKLEGRRVRCDQMDRIQTPFILLRESHNPGAHGHYVLARWVDHQQTLQLIDAPREPRLVPRNNLLNFPEVTFACLLPVEERSLFMFLILPVVLIATVVGFFAMKRRYRIFPSMIGLGKAPLR